ncbi:MAG: hypothetical protein ACRCTI_18780 [Beijerinckiaceae bacterium]
MRSADMMRGLAAAGLVALSAGAAAAQGPSVFREVRVDLSGLPPGAAETRRAIGVCLSQNLPVALAGRLNPAARGAPVLVVRPTNVWLAPPATPSGDEQFGGRPELSSPDSMEGEAIVGGTRIPLRVSGGFASSSPIAALQVAYQRTDTLCQNFAYWLARKI